MGTLDRLRQMYMETYGVDPEEDLASQAQPIDPLTGLQVQSPLASPQDQLPAIAEPPVAPEAPVLPDAGSLGFPATTQPPAVQPVTEQPVASGAIPPSDVSLSTQTQVPLYQQTGTDNTSRPDIDAIKAADVPMAPVAEEYSTVTDSALASMGRNYGDLEQSIAGLATADEQTALIEAQAAERRIVELEQARREAENQVVQADQEVARIAETEPDVGRFWSSRSAGQKALYYITAALQAFSKPDEVPKVAGLLLEFIDKDTKIQQDRIGSELAAAKGRASSVRDLIVAGKAADEAKFALDMSKIRAWDKASKAKFIAAGQTAEARMQRDKEAMALVSAATQLKTKYADQVMEGRKLDIMSQSMSARGGGGGGGPARKAPAVYPDGSMYTNDHVTVTSPDGSTVDKFVPRPKATEEIALASSAHANAREGLQSLVGVVDEAASQGRSSTWMLQNDPEFATRFNSVIRRIAQAQGYEKNVSDREGESVMLGLIGVKSADELTGMSASEIAQRLQHRGPKDIAAAIRRTSASLDAGLRARMISTADIGWYESQGRGRPNVYIRPMAKYDPEGDIRDKVMAAQAEDVQSPDTAVKAILPIGTSSKTDAELARIATETQDKGGVDVRKYSEGLSGKARSRAERLADMLDIVRESGADAKEKKALERKQISLMKRDGELSADEMARLEKLKADTAEAERYLKQEGVKR